MNQDEILKMFRQHADDMPNEDPVVSALILELARLLADSRGRLSKENFDTLVCIGGALFKMGQRQFHAKSDVDAIMKESLKDEATARKSR